MPKAASTSETSVSVYQTTRRYDPGACHLLSAVCQSDKEYGENHIQQQIFYGVFFFVNEILILSVITLS
jgi:hypothetical protein